MKINQSLLEELIRTQIEIQLEKLKRSPDGRSSEANHLLARYMNRRQTAQYIGCGLSTVDYWARTKKLNKLKIDGATRFDRLEIDEAIQQLRKFTRK